MGKGLFGGIEDAQVQKRGAYIPVGNHEFDIEAVKYVDGRNEEFFCAELVAVSSDNPSVRKGSPYSWLVKMSLDAALPNIKEFLAAASDCDPDEVDQAGAEAAVSEENPLAGRRVRCQAIEITTKANKPFTRCNWSAAEQGEASEEQAAEEEEPAPKQAKGARK